MPVVLEDCVPGQRIVIRYRRGDGAGEPPLTDVVGLLSSLDADTARVQARTGLVSVAVADIVAARPVAAARRDVLDLERIAAAGWQAAHVRELDGWLLRADTSHTRRANSALPLASPRRPLSQLLADVSDFYRDQDLPTLIQVPLTARGLLDAELARLCWPAEAETVVMTRHLPMAVDHTVELSEMPPAGYPDLPLLTRHSRLRFALARRDEMVLASARGVVDDGWLGITQVQVDPSARRQGLAGMLIAGLADWAVQAHQARRCYLQVQADNMPALALYRGLGFSAHHRYHYRRAPLSVPSPGF
jgi:GNAT superfamily N-acetyltransferase